MNDLVRRLGAGPELNPEGWRWGSSRGNSSGGVKEGLCVWKAENPECGRAQTQCLGGQARKWVYT